MVKGGIKRTPLQFLENILERALQFDLISREEITHLLAQDASIQENIDAWRPLVRDAEKEPTREWVVTTGSFFEGVAVHERIDEVVFTCYADACDCCSK
jgi:hypothetical protein